MMGGGYGHEFGFMQGGFGILWMILIFGGLIALILFAVRGLRRTHTGGTPPTSEKTPLEILKERYAQGEIDGDEFEDRKRRLSQ
ncbi:MAG: SHOCT domain-containing protein [Sneathiella sp.]|nr:SHOCT domain-containing protein [Sneathiella sp.]